MNIFHTKDITLVVTNGKPVATSRDIATHFNKHHKNVLQSIETIIER
jgi:phage regulator Rha-like protein